MSTPAEVMATLDGLATELDTRSRELADVERRLEPTELAYVGLVNSRKRLEKRIGALKSAVDAQRSILSALKVEMEAGGGTMRRAA